MRTDWIEGDGVVANGHSGSLPPIMGLAFEWVSSSVASMPWSLSVRVVLAKQTMDEKPTKWTPLVRGTTVGITQAAQQMRKDLTDFEAIVWDEIRERRLGGLRFRRQHPAGRFIFDFYCPRAKLVVEVDGGVHDGQAEYDAERTAELERFGYTVIRFKNEDIRDRLPEVLDEIERTARRLISEQSPRSTDS